MLERLLCGKDQGAASLFARRGMGALYIIIASLHYSQRVPHACDSTLKRLSAALTRKGRGK
eukprot:2896063-Pleurochrysis_carterae.AAC.1